MARIVTPELEQAKESMRRCLALDLDKICPGHRGPLTKNVPAQCQEMTKTIDDGLPWPLLG
jgi:hypothetical protein